MFPLSAPIIIAAKLFSFARRSYTYWVFSKCVKRDEFLRRTNRSFALAIDDKERERCEENEEERERRMKLKE